MSSTRNQTTLVSLQLQFCLIPDRENRLSERVNEFDDMSVGRIPLVVRPSTGGECWYTKVKRVIKLSKPFKAPSKP